jgi:hypothetical protein
VGRLAYSDDVENGLDAPHLGDPEALALVELVVSARPKDEAEPGVEEGLAEYRVEAKISCSSSWRTETKEEEERRTAMTESKSEKKGIASPMMKAMIQPMSTMTNQVAQPLKVCDLRWMDFSSKSWKKTARLVTREY